MNPIELIFVLLKAYYNSDPNAVVTADDVFIFLVTFMKLGQNYDAVFPLLDILRLSMLNFSVAQYLTGKLLISKNTMIF